MTIQQILLGIGGGVAPFTLQYFLVGGGGGTTGGSSAGGGGWGGIVTSMAGEYGGAYASAETPPLVQPGVTYTVVVGAGGSWGSNGGDTYITAGGTTYGYAFGGGGGNNTGSGNAGGCGGGGAGSSPFAGGSGSQGYSGGSGSGGTPPPGAPWYCPWRPTWAECIPVSNAGGGGGAASAGGTASSYPGTGGNGLSTSFLGFTATFGAGGAGNNSDQNATNSNGSGWGSYGSGGNALNSQSGTSGVAYLRVPASAPLATTSASNAVVGSHRIYTFTSTATIQW